MPKKLTLSEFKFKARQVHKNKFDYSEVLYENNKKHVNIVCPIHGNFLQTPGDHLAGKGCSKCSKYTTRWDTNSFIQRVDKIHKGIYDYSETTYTTNKYKVIIKCKSHGNFEIHPNHHINGYGCPSCGKNVSLVELEFIALFESKNLNVISGYRPSWLKNKELDIFIPSLNLALEFNGGIYHHSHIDSDISYLKNGYKNKLYHLDKYETCKNNSVKLIHIFDFEDKEFWKARILDYLLNPINYTITFDNVLRTFKYKNKDIKCYGKSNIILSPLM